MIHYLCTFCQEELRPPEFPEEKEELISHGLCRPCLEKAMSRHGRSLNDYLRQFKEPVLVIDQNGRAITANDAGQQLLGKEMDEIEGYLGGEIFGCQHAQEEGGCGETLHCLSCVIRNTVEETYRTGIPHHKVPACQDLDTVAGPRKVRFIISTEKIDHSVLLKIDNIATAEEQN